MSITLVERRVNLGMSQAELALHCEVATETIRKVEDGHRPTPRIGKRIADFYGLVYTDLWPIAVDTEEAA